MPYSQMCFLGEVNKLNRPIMEKVIINVYFSIKHLKCFPEININFFQDNYLTIYIVLSVYFLCKKYILRCVLIHYKQKSHFWVLCL